MKSGNVFCINCIYSKDLGSAGFFCRHPSTDERTTHEKTPIHPRRVEVKAGHVLCTTKNRLNDCPDYDPIKELNNWWKMVKAQFKS